MSFKKAVSYLKFIHISFKKYPSGKQSLNFSLLQIKQKAIYGARNMTQENKKKALQMALHPEAGTSKRGNSLSSDCFNLLIFPYFPVWNPTSLLFRSGTKGFMFYSNKTQKAIQIWVNRVAYVFWIISGHPLKVIQITCIFLQIAYHQRKQ